MFFLGKARQVLFEKAWEINAVMKRKDSNCIGILSDQGEDGTASDISEYTIIKMESYVKVNIFFYMVDYSKTPQRRTNVFKNQ